MPPSNTEIKKYSIIKVGLSVFVGTDKQIKDMDKVYMEGERVNYTGTYVKMNIKIYIIHIRYLYYIVKAESICI